MDESKAGKAKVGELVTLVYPQDRLPGMVLKEGYQYAGCVPVWLGEARYFRNFAD